MKQSILSSKFLRRAFRTQFMCKLDQNIIGLRLFIRRYLSLLFVKKIYHFRNFVKNTILTKLSHSQLLNWLFRGKKSSILEEHLSNSSY